MIVIVGNKSDLSESRVVNDIEAKQVSEREVSQYSDSFSASFVFQFAQGNKVQYYETSAKTCQNLDQVMPEKLVCLYKKNNKKKYFWGVQRDGGSAEGGVRGRVSVQHEEQEELPLGQCSWLDRGTDIQVPYGQSPLLLLNSYFEY